jgi:Rrf2 family cysteine metabolism transcriptional repressor
MEMSTRGRYALRALLDVAFHEQEGPVSRSDIAARQGISADYIAQLFRSLASAGLVKGVKGPGGGYVLGREPAAIRVGDIVRAVEGPIAAVYCAVPGSLLSCPRSDGCATRQLWVELSQAIAQFLDSVTLKDLCDRASVVADVLDTSGAGDQEGLDHLSRCAITSSGI